MGLSVEPSPQPSRSLFSLNFEKAKKNKTSFQKAMEATESENRDTIFSYGVWCLRGARYVTLPGQPDWKVVFCVLI